VETSSSSLCESFETLRHKVVRTLHQKGYVQHQALNITVEHGTVTVEGSVPTWHLRQIAVECIRRVTGVVGVVDRIRVVTESQDGHTPCSGGKR
jgi:osmotically-inducible protein OsmY